MGTIMTDEEKQAWIKDRQEAGLNIDPEEAQERLAWLTIRQEAGLKIDPETAEVDWEFGQVLDPYGIDRELIKKYPETYDCIGRVYFARAPGSDVWVHFSDLPEATREALGKKRVPAFTHGRRT